MRNIDLEEFKMFGIHISGNEMNNGELRFRMTGSESSYIRVESRNAFGWQNSHYHKEQSEWFLVEKGEVFAATLINGKVEIKKYSAGSIFIIHPMVPHNLNFMKGSISHTIKYGGIQDWNASYELDNYLKDI